MWTCEDVFTDYISPLSGLSCSHESSQWFIQTMSRRSEFSLPLTQPLSPHFNSSVYLPYLVWSFTFVHTTHIHYTDGLYCKCICIVCSTWLQSPYTTDFTWVLWSEIHHPSIDPGCGTCCHEDQVSCCCTMLYIIGSEFWEGWQVAAHLQAPARPRVFPKYIKMSDGIIVYTYIAPFKHVCPYDLFICWGSEWKSLKKTLSCTFKSPI